MSKRAKIMTAGVALLIAMFAAFFLWKHNRVVARIDGVHNFIYYNGQVYEEYFRNHSFETAAYLGLLDWGDGKTKSRLYAIEGQPAYLYVDMGWDHRIYVITDTQ